MYGTGGRSGVASPVNKSKSKDLCREIRVSYDWSEEKSGLGKALEEELDLGLGKKLWEANGGESERNGKYIFANFFGKN